VRDRGLDPADLNKIELPDSLHTLILSRIDQLSEREKTTLRVASIVGRLFRADWLPGYYPELGGMNRVKSDLEQLAGLDITPLDTPEPELAYLFKHIVTHEVTYESLPFATRAKLHEQLAAYLEEQIGGGALRETSLLETLVFHYLHSDNPAKQREYLRKAAGAAQDVSAFKTAVDYLARLMELTRVDDPARSALASQLAEAHYKLGDFPAARTAIEQAQAAATTDADRAGALARLGGIVGTLGNLAEAQTILAEAVPLARASGDALTLCRTLVPLGELYWMLGKLEDAKIALDESLALARALGNTGRELFALNGLGAVAIHQGDLNEAEGLFSEIHTRAVTVGNRELAMSALNNLGVTADMRQDFAAMGEYCQQVLAIAREIGAQQSIAMGLCNLAYANIKLGKLADALAGLREGLALAQRLGAVLLLVDAVINFAELAYAEGQNERAFALLGLTRNHPAWNNAFQRQVDTMLAEWALIPSVVDAGMKKGEELDWEATIQDLLKE